MTSIESTAPVLVSLDRDDGIYQPGASLEAAFEVLDNKVQRPRSLEFSVIWYTTGKGDEDLHVHEFERRAATGDASFGLPDSFRLSTRLPMSPLSYRGTIVKVCWCVRVRCYFEGGKQAMLEQPFQLGMVDSMPEQSPKEASE